MNLEYGVTIHFLSGAIILFSTTDNLAPVFIHYSNHDADITLFNFDALLQERMDGIGEILRGGAKGKCR